jgi:hypothetical protein
MDDKALRQNIIDELDFEPSINAANIGVAVEKGVVTLTGHVESHAEKIAAERAVERVRGVRQSRKRSRCVMRGTKGEQTTRSLRGPWTSSIGASKFQWTASKSRSKTDG